MIVKRVRFVILFFTPLLFQQAYAVSSFLTNARALVAYGENGAYAITQDNKILQWNNTNNIWDKLAESTPALKMLDCDTTGSTVFGLGTDNYLYAWNGESGLSSTWTKTHGNNQYEWISIDEENGRTMGKRLNLNAWEFWDQKTATGGDPWYEYLPIENGNEAATKNLLYLVDKRNNTGAYNRWEETDLDYLISINQFGENGGSFDIHYCDTGSSGSIGTISNAPSNTHAIKHISFDEINQNLWGIATSGKTYWWNNTTDSWDVKYARQTTLSLASNAASYSGSFVRAMAWNGNFLAVGGEGGKIEVFEWNDSTKLLTLRNDANTYTDSSGVINTVSWRANRLGVAGINGVIKEYSWNSATYTLTPL